MEASATYILKEEVIGVGDVSIDNFIGIHAYIQESTDEKVKIQGAVHVEADEEDITSNRGKGCTVLAMVKLSSIRATFFGISKVSLKIQLETAETLCHFA